MVSFPIHVGRKISFSEAYERDSFIAHSLNLLNLDSKQVSIFWTLERPKGFAYRHAPLWLPEDRGLLVQIADIGQKTRQFYTYDLASGSHEPFDLPLDREMDRWYHATLSSDGTSLIFVKEDRKATAWAIQNID